MKRTFFLALLFLLTASGASLAIDAGIWNPTEAPSGNPTTGDPNEELGTVFYAAHDGNVTALKFYKASGETGTHTGRLWSSSGTLLASVNFTGETTSGWQEQALTTPVAIKGGVIYVVSYTENTAYPISTHYFDSAKTKGDLTAPATGSVPNGNGVFVSNNPGNFPTHTFNASSYWVDVVFTATTSNPPYHYVDNSLGSNGDGSSWSSAWNSLTNVGTNGGILSPGDVVYLSGGASGSTQTYTLSSAWSPAGGTNSARITYKIGQDSSHNGTVRFAGPASGFSDWLTTCSEVNISGDAGDGNKHFVIADGTGGNGIDHGWWGDGSHDVRVSYVDFGTLQDYPVHLNSTSSYPNGVSGIEIDHCKFYKINRLDSTQTREDGVMYVIGDGSAFDNVLIHDNELNIERIGDGTGDDGIQAVGGGVSFYNNRVISHQTNLYAYSQHQDGLQPSGAVNVKIYNNYFENIANYAVFGDAYGGNFSHFYVFNNVIVINGSDLQNGNAPKGIAIGPDGGAFGFLGYWPSFTDVIVANNLIVDYGSNHAAITLYDPGNPGDLPSTFTNCAVYNNVSVNSGGYSLENDPTYGVVANANNLLLTMANGTGHYVSYTQNQGPQADFHLVSADALFRGQGTNLTAMAGGVMTSDKDGVARPSTGNWDIGPYQYASASSLPTPGQLTGVRIGR